jgi:hypothetical protein
VFLYLACKVSKRATNEGPATSFLSFILLMLSTKLCRVLIHAIDFFVFEIFGARSSVAIIFS